MNSFIANMVSQGVPETTIALLLMLPIIATFIAMVRQIIGLKGFGLYTPLIISFAFVETTLKYGVALFVFVLIAGTITRLIVRKARLLYLPRIAIVTSVVALTILFVFYEGAYSGRNGLITVSIFPLLIIITLVEKFVAAQIESGARSAVVLTLETLIIAIAAFYVITWAALQDFLLAYPWAILVTLIVNIILGRYTGLRLTEFIRFRDVIQHVELPRKK